MTKQARITLEERIFIQKSVQKMDIRKIAEILEITGQEIENELKRCPEGNYDAHEADKAAKAVKRAYHILTLDDRLFIQENLDKMSIRQIAQRLDICVATLYCELKRCPEGRYDAYRAEMIVQNNRSVRNRNARNTIRKQVQEKKHRKL